MKTNTNKEKDLKKIFKKKPLYFTLQAIAIVQTFFCF
jgi:hypothetical protein